MTIYEIRKINLLALIAERGERGQSVLADNIGKTASQVNQYAHAKNMGTGFARSLEKALNKPSGWMDVLHREHENTLPKSKIPSVRKGCKRQCCCQRNPRSFHVQNSLMVNITALSAGPSLPSP